MRFTGASLPPGVTELPKPSGTAPGFHIWSIGTLAPGATGSIIAQTLTNDLSILSPNTLFMDDFNYTDSSQLFNLWTTSTPLKFTTDGQSGVVATATGADSDYLSLINPV